MPADRPQHVVETVQLTKVFRDFWHRSKVKALDRLNLQVRRGEVYGLLGPNGSGKSTTIKLLLGLLFPTSGAVRVLGRPPRDIQVKSRIGFLPEETYLYPYLDARETLDFFGRLSQLSRRERRRRVDALVDMVGLAGARNRPLREYSKGMARRIGLAQALINDPELILLDEPTTGLDPIGTREVKDLLAQLKERGKSILLCSHLLADVEDVCDRIGILYAGRLFAEGEVGQLLARQRVTQITVPDLSPQEAERLRELVRQAAPERKVELGHPLDRLENFFLRVIREAREAQPETAGVGAGRFDASLFRREAPPTPQEVLQRLTARPEEEEGGEEPQAPPEEPAEAERRAALERLTAAEPEPAEEPQEEEAPEAQAPDEEAERRRSVLDRLVHSPGEEGPGDKEAEKSQDDDAPGEDERSQP
ncbi:MAG: ABC transporter ATP-binding protein [bacterium]